MRAARMVMAGAAALAAATGMLAGAGRAAAQPSVLYATVTATGTGDCSAAADGCTLSTALGQVTAGGVIELVTPGGDTAASRYVGNWTVGTAGTSASAPVTIEAASGLAGQPVLDGDGPNAPAGETCSTASCDGPVLTVPAGEHVALSGITIADGNNTSSGTGGGLDNAGSVTITTCTFTGNSTGGDNIPGFGGAIDNGDGFYGGGTGTVTVAASTFTGNTAIGLGGAIDSGSNRGGGSVTVTASTFTGNTANSDGGAIDSGDLFGGGSVTVAASTFTGNTAGGDGGAIDSGDSSGGGSVTVTDSTLTGNTAIEDGGAINRGGGTSTVQVAGNVFNGSCDQAASGFWADGGYNAGSDASCFSPSPATGDVNAGSPSALELGPLASNGGPTQTIAPQPGSPVIAIIPDPTTVTLGGNQVVLCPATDQRGYTSAAGTGCDAGAVQTSGSPPAFTLKISATPASFNHAGQVITYHYEVTNTGAGALSGITVTDPAVPGVSCPASLPPGTSVICTGSSTVTSADLAAGKITETAAAAGATTDGVLVTSNTATLTVPEGWPPVVSGSFRPPAGGAGGYYLGVTGSTWSLTVTHPGTGKVTFTGTVTLNAGAYRNLTRVGLGPGDSVQVSHKTLTFQFTDSGSSKGIRFATSPADTAITFTLAIGGTPAIASQLYLGGTPTQASSGSPLTFTR